MQQQEMTRVRLEELRGENVYDNRGEKIGSVEEIYYDPESRSPEWIGIGTGFFGTKRVLVPVQGAHVSGDGLTVDYAKDRVKDSPDIDEDDITTERESELCAYYGITSTPSYTDTDAGTTQQDSDQAMTRSE